LHAEPASAFPSACFDQIHAMIQPDDALDTITSAGFRMAKCAQMHAVQARDFDLARSAAAIAAAILV